MTAVATIAAAQPRNGLTRVVSQSLTMAYRGLLKVRRTPEQLFDVTLQPVIFTVMFAYIFGGSIAGSVTGYLPILIPGILVQTVITGSVVTGTQLREDMDKGVFDRFRSLPIARIAPLAGALLADTVRYALATAITFVVGGLMGYHQVFEHLGWTVAAGLLVIVVAWSISWIFALFGMLARTASSVQGISMLVLFPLTFLSNAYVDTSKLPDWLAWFADVNPISHLVSAVRAMVNAQQVTGDVGLSLVGAAAVVAVLAPLTVRAYMRKA